MPKLRYAPAKQRHYLIRHYKLLLFVALLVAIGAVVQMRFHNLETTARLAGYENLACDGVGVAMNNGVIMVDTPVRMFANSVGAPFWNHGPSAKDAIGGHQCEIASTVQAKRQRPNGLLVNAGGNSLQAGAYYFRSSKAAETYAKDYNAHRSWSVDDAGVKAGIPQTSLFTYIVTDVDKPYVLGYTVTSSAFLDLSFPCNMAVSADQNVAFDICNKLAQKVLRQYGDKVQAHLATGQLY